MSKRTKKQQQAQPTTTQTHRSLFSHVSCDIVLSITSFLEQKDIGRLACSCSLLRSRVSLSLTGSISPGLASLRHVTLQPKPRDADRFASVLSRANRLQTLSLIAADNEADQALLTAPYPHTLTHLFISSQLDPSRFLPVLAKLQALATLHLHAYRNSVMVDATAPTADSVSTFVQGFLPALTSLTISTSRKFRPDVGGLVLKLLCPSLRMLRIENAIVDDHRFPLLQEISKQRLSELSFARVGYVWLQQQTTFLHSMPTLTNLKLCHGAFSYSQRLSDFPPSLTTLQCAVAAMFETPESGCPLPALTDLTLICQGNHAPDIQTKTQFLKAATALNRWNPPLQRLVIDCRAPDACRTVHDRSEWLSVLQMINDNDNAFPKLKEFSANTFRSEVSDRSEAAFKKLLKSLKAKRPELVLKLQ